MLPRFRFFVAFIATFLPSATLVQAGSNSIDSTVLHLTMDTAIRMALRKNYSLRVEELNPTIAKQRVVAARAEFDPNFTASFDRSEDTLRTFFADNRRVLANEVDRIDRFTAGFTGRTPIGTAYGLGVGTRNTTGSANAFDDLYQSDLSLDLRQPLLRGFGTDANLVNVRIARINVESSEWEFRRSVIDTITQIEYAYYDLHSAHEELRVATSSRELARQLMHDNEMRAAIGVGTPLSITTARAEVAAREQFVILSRRKVLDFENVLKKLVTDDLMQMLTTRVRINPPVFTTSSPDVVTGIGQALALRPEYRQSIFQLQRRNVQLAFQKNQVLPQLDLRGSLGLLGAENDIGSSFSRVGSRDRTSWSAGAVFSIPLGNREARANLATAKTEVAQAILDLQRLEQDIIVQVDNAAGQIRSNKERVAATTEATRLARESLDAGEKFLQAGAGTTFEVLELQKRLAEAEASEVNARADYNKSISEYARQTGTTLRRWQVRVD